MPYILIYNKYAVIHMLYQTLMLSYQKIFPNIWYNHWVSQWKNALQLNVFKANIQS
jgi:hypothetical protein